MSTNSPRPGSLNASGTTAQPQGSRTITINPNEERTEDDRDGSQTSPRLHLRARPIRENVRSNTRVQWEDNVVDNEGLGRKKSKICCIYKKPRAFDESSDESGDSDSDCCSDSHHYSTPNPGSSSSNPNGRPSNRPETSPPNPVLITSPPRSPRANAYEIEPSKLKGKGRAR